MRSDIFRTRMALLGGAVFFSLPTVSFAQDDPQSQASQGGSDTTIVVTGRSDGPFATDRAAPVQMITADMMQAKGFTEIGEAIREMPFTGPGNSDTGGQGRHGAGRSYPALFSLGTNRTLTVVNGRRFISANAASLFSGAPAGDQVDLNSIPTALIERVETLPATGGALYGSGALAGTVNVILRDSFEGAELDGQYGINEHGQAPNWRLRGTAGHTFLDQRANIAVSVEYNRSGGRNGLLESDRIPRERRYLFAPNPANTGPDDGIPAEILVTDRTRPLLTFGGLPLVPGSNDYIMIADGAGGTTPAQFGPDGQLIPFDPGNVYGPDAASGGDGVAFTDITALQSPIERWLGTALARFDLTDDIRLKGELFASRVDAVFPVEGAVNNAPFMANHDAGLVISTSNPFLDPAVRAVIEGQGLEEFTLSRASREFTLRGRREGRTDTIRGVIALEGDFSALGRQFHWDVSANIGHVDGSSQRTGLLQDNFLQAIQAVRDPATGDIVCQGVLDGDPAALGCEPLNLFGENAPSEASLAYVSDVFESSFSAEQRIYRATFGGELVKLPGGMLNFLLGVEHRRETASFIPGENERLGRGRLDPVNAIAGSFTTRDLFVQAQAPLVAPDNDIPLIEELSVEGSYRFVDNSMVGTDEAWSVGGQWRPVRDVMLRGTRSRAYRAPAVLELFRPTVSITNTAVDPCDARNIGTGPSPDLRRANCEAHFAALGLPADYELTSQIQDTPVQGVVSGNPDLGNAISNSWTAGIVLTPRWMPGFSLAFDWVDIHIDNSITAPGAGQVLSSCYDAPEFGNAFCGNFSRDDQGQITELNTSYINGGYTDFAGATLIVNYSTSLGDMPLFSSLSNPATLSATWNAFFVDKQVVSTSGNGFDLNDERKEVSRAAQKWRADIGYTRGPLNLSWTISYIGESNFDNNFTRENRTMLTIDDYYLHSVRMRYDITDNFAVRAGVNNLFDTPPPYGTYGIGTYDLIGRSFFMGATASF